MHRLDFSDVRGNDAAVCALADAAGSRTNVILTGPPGIGKTMIARRSPGLLGPLADREAAWLEAEYGAIGMECRFRGVPTRAQVGDDPHLSTEDVAAAQNFRPFRAPHHTVSAAGMSGANQRKHRIACPEVRGYLDRLALWHGIEPYRCQCEHLGGKESIFRPGECHLARFGILFLDDLIEFPRSVVEAIVHTIASMSPLTRPWLIASATPCPCGWSGSGVRECACTVGMIDRWRDRLSTSIRKLEIGANIPVLPVSLSMLRDGGPGASTEDLRARVAPARIEAAS